MLENKEAATSVLSVSSHAGISHQPTSGSWSGLEPGADGAIGEPQLRGADELAHFAHKTTQPWLRNASQSTLHAERVPGSRDDGEPAAAAGQWSKPNLRGRVHSGEAARKQQSWQLAK